MTERIFNFSAGPAVLPLPVLEEAQRDMLSLPGVGMSVMEISHRSKTFDAIIHRADPEMPLSNIATMGDIVDGQLDIGGSVAREIEEETGLTEADYRRAPYWDCVVTGPSVAIMQLLTVDLPGEALKARIEANLAKQAHPELSAIHLVRSVDDLGAGVPRFVTAFLEHQFNAE